MNHQKTDNIQTNIYSRTILILGCCLLFAFSFLLFSGTWQKELLGKDEDLFKDIPKYIGENFNFYKIQPHTPFSALSFILIQKFSLSISSQYIFNWIIHTLNALLLFIFLTRKSKDIPIQILALLLSALFLIHPLNIYSTSFLINRGGLLSSLFTLLLLLTLYVKDEPTSYRLYPFIFSIILVLLSTFSHFIAIVLVIPMLYFVYSNKYQEGDFINPLFYGYGVFCILLSTLILLLLYQYNFHTDIFQVYPPLKYFNIISGFFILFLFPTAFFPLQYFELNSFLSVPITLIVFLLLFVLGFYFYKKSKVISLLLCLIVILSVAIYPAFQKLDISMCNSSYFLILNITIFGYFLLQNFSEKNKIIGKIFTIFVLILLCFLSIFSYQLTYELRDQERLWLACAGNNTSNPEAWKYLARTLTKKTQQDTSQRDIYLEKAEQSWNTLLELQPENTEALREKSLLCLETGRYDEAQQNIAKCIGLNPFESLSIRTQIKIIEKEIENGNDINNNLWKLYNSYITLYLINKHLNNDEKSKFLKIAQKLSNYEQAWEILKQNFETINETAEKTDYRRGYDDIQKALIDIPVLLLNSGDTFKPPFTVLAVYYEKKGLLSLSQAWLSFGFYKEQHNIDLLIKLGVLYGKMNKTSEFIEKWGNFLKNDSQLCEKLSRECINNNDFNSSQYYIEQTPYSTSKKYTILSNIAIEKGHKEQAKLWLEKAKENSRNPEETQEINELINKIR